MDSPRAETATRPVRDDVAPGHNGVHARAVHIEECELLQNEIATSVDADAAGAVDIAVVARGGRSQNHVLTGRQADDRSCAGGFYLRASDCVGAARQDVAGPALRIQGHVAGRSHIFIL